ncbi:hypothetical protein Hanom_Chr11g01012131 [Helianthus anomalus]
MEQPVGGDPKETGAAATTAREKAQGPEVVHVTGLEQPLYAKQKEPSAEERTRAA